MKRKFNLWTHFDSYLNKLFREIKIAVLIILASSSIASGAVTELQQQPITGKVTDTNGEPLPGVNIVIKGTVIGAITGLDGRYIINAPDRNGVLVFTFIGYIDQEISVNGRSTVDVQMALETTTLSEVVVTALGIKREAKTLGYATAVVNQGLLTENRTSTTIGTLAGESEWSQHYTFRNRSCRFHKDQDPGKLCIPGSKSASSGSQRGSHRQHKIPGRFNADLGDGLNSINPVTMYSQ